MFQKNQKSNKKSKSRNGGVGTAQPIQFKPTVQVDHKFRFQASAAGSSTITTDSLGDLLCVAATATSAYQLAKSIRIRRVEMWGPPASNLSPVTVALEWEALSAGSFGNSIKLSDTSVGSTRVAHLNAKPPKSTQVSMWQSATAGNNLFTLTYPVGAIIDIHYSMTVREDAGAQAVTGAVAGATVGQVYCRNLDSTGSNLLNPVSYISI